MIQCPFHGWRWDTEGRNVRIPYEPRPNRGRRMRTYPVIERNESVYLWHDTGSNGGSLRDLYFDVPDVFGAATTHRRPKPERRISAR